MYLIFLGWAHRDDPVIFANTSTISFLALPYTYLILADTSNSGISLY